MKILINTLFIFCFSLSCIAGDKQQNHIDSATGIASWEIYSHGVTFSVTQILPEQAKAFYINRGFELRQIESYTSSCLYMTVMRNDKAPGTVHFVKKNWFVSYKGKSHPLLSVTQWIKKLEKNNVKKSALLAFRYAQFPPEQEFEPGGDWNQGMLSIGLPAESQFDLIARWDIDGKTFETKLQRVKCAK